jgi:hypothetical protein
MYQVQVSGPFLGSFLNDENNPEKRVSQPLKIGYMDRPAGRLLAIRKIWGRDKFLAKL